MSNTKCSDECTLPAGHPGYHYDERSGMQWVGGPMNRDGSRPRPREQWTFAERYTAWTGRDFYVWQLLNPDGSVNSVWVYPVDLMRTNAGNHRRLIGGGQAWVDAREGE